MDGRVARSPEAAIATRSPPPICRTTRTSCARATGSLSGYEATLALMRLSDPPTAIFCANDLMAVGCFEALKELGRRVPEDVAVMGYDDREIAQFTCIRR